MIRTIAHRGGAGLAPENSLKAIETALSLKADAIEIDLRLTADQVFVAHHDSTLKKHFGLDRNVSEISYEELMRLKPFHGEPILRIEQVLEATKSNLLILEPKGGGWAEPLARALPASEAIRIQIIAFGHDELINFKKLRPDIVCIALERRRPSKTVRLAHTNNLQGINVHWRSLHPVSYRKAKKKGMLIYVYTVDNPIIQWLLLRLYPKTGITTNRPDTLQRQLRRMRVPKTQDIL